MALCLHPRSPKRSSRLTSPSQGARRRGVAPWHTLDMETALPIQVLAAGGRMGDAEASLFRSGSGEEQVWWQRWWRRAGARKRRGPHRVQCGQAPTPVLKRQPPALAHVCCTGECLPMKVFMDFYVFNVDKLFQSF